MSERCRSCLAPITWARTPKGKRIPLDAQPPDDVTPNLVLSEGPRGTIATVTSAVGTHVSHFATCPNAGSHRKRDRTKGKRDA